MFKFSSLIVNRNLYFLSIICLLTFVTLSCSDDNEVLSGEKMITFFSLRTLENPNNLNNDVSTTIDQNNLTITGEFNTGDTVTSIVPIITISDNATISPSINQPIDFSNPVVFTVTAQDGSTEAYTVTINLSSQKEIVRFYFTSANNPSLSSTVEGEVNNFNKQVLLDLPLGANITSLIPTIEINSKSISPASNLAVDFTETQIYTLTADDLSTVDFNISANFDRSTLIKFGELNGLFPNYWFIDGNHSSWSGVTTGDMNRVTSLVLDSQGLRDINYLIPELGSLTELITLNLAGSGGSNIITSDYGNLINLQNCLLLNLGITSVSPAIGNLSNLELLYLYGNNIRSLPSTIGQLNNLDVLSLWRNNLNLLPSTVGNLTNLTQLDVSDNNLTSLPSSIGNMDALLNLTAFSNQLTIIPAEIGNLNSIEVLHFAENNLYAVPSEISNLTTLLGLELFTNNLNSIPQSVCDMRTLYGTNINLDSGVSCQ